MQDKLKEDKQKVTLYLPQDLHRQLKIRAAVDSETMTDITQRAIGFYLAHPEIVDQYEESYGQVHRVYSCPSCSNHLVVRDGEMRALGVQTGVLIEESLSVESRSVGADAQQGEGELVPC
jgi:hypothetical protein